jgi:hypothetical protein
MNAYQHFGHRREQVAHLGKSVLYELAAPKYEDKREELIAQWADPSTKVTLKDVKAALPIQPKPKQLSDPKKEILAKALGLIQKVPLEDQVAFMQKQLARLQEEVRHGAEN